MKKFTSLIAFTSFFLFASIAAHAQDVIIKNDRTEIQSKVIEITDTQIKYKKTAMPDGPLYTLNKTDVYMIIYKNGTRETYTTTPPAAQTIAVAPPPPPPAAKPKPVYTPQRASEPEPREHAFSIGNEVEAILPVGTFANAVTAGLGVSLKGIYTIPRTNSSITATLNVDYFLTNSNSFDGSDLTYESASIKLGYMAMLPYKFFVEPQAGVYFLEASENGYHATSTNPVAGGQVGYYIKDNASWAVRLAVGYHYVYVSNGGSYSFAGFSCYFSY